MSAAKTIVVVNNPKDWPLEIPEVRVVAARSYLTDPVYGNQRGLQVYNLCKSYRYQSTGYYVSLLAEARSHRPLPRISAIEDLQSQNIVRLVAASVDELVATALAPLRSDEFVLSIYFGRNIAERYNALSRQIFDLFQAPLLRVQFVKRQTKRRAAPRWAEPKAVSRQGDEALHPAHTPSSSARGPGERFATWQVASVKTIAASDIPAAHQEFAVSAARLYFAGRGPRPRRRRPPLFEMAILRDPEETHPASNAQAIKKFAAAARELGIQTEVLGRGDGAALRRFDALFIRDNTFINHYTYRFSRRAAAEGLVVIDDPDSILRCNNKVYLAELLPRHGIPVPKTLLVNKDNVEQIIPTLGLPCVLKQPDSSFSLGVKKAESEEELLTLVARLLEKSELIVAQEYLPTEFDWRIGILDRRPLFACQYYMAPGHWQIVQHDAAHRHYVEGSTKALPIAEAPAAIVKMALKAANLIGDGFYGVDIKEAGRGYRVIEVNDNPNVDAGNEDGVLKAELYLAVMRSFLRRLNARHG